MEWLLYIGLSLGSAGGSSALTYWITRKPEQPQTEQVAKGQIEVQKNLTEPDLLELPCSLDYITARGEGLCREMFCRMTTRGIDSKTSGSECESISNTINKALILEVCAKPTELDEQKKCIEFFDRRI